MGRGSTACCPSCIHSRCQVTATVVSLSGICRSAFSRRNPGTSSFGPSSPPALVSSFPPRVPMSPCPLSPSRVSREFTFAQELRSDLHLCTSVPPPATRGRHLPPETMPSPHVTLPACPLRLRRFASQHASMPADPHAASGRVCLSPYSILDTPMPSCPRVLQSSCPRCEPLVPMSPCPLVPSRLSFAQRAYASFAAF